MNSSGVLWVNHTRGRRVEVMTGGKAGSVLLAEVRKARASTLRGSSGSQGGDEVELVGFVVSAGRRFEAFCVVVRLGYAWVQSAKRGFVGRLHPTVGAALLDIVLRDERERRQGEGVKHGQHEAG